jgi:hypothetical protein
MSDGRSSSLITLRLPDWFLGESRQKAERKGVPLRTYLQEALVRDGGRSHHAGVTRVDRVHNGPGRPRKAIEPG